MDDDEDRRRSDDDEDRRRSGRGESGERGERGELLVERPASTVESCANDADDRDYRGTISETQNGATCQKWTAQSPHRHGVTPEARPDKGLGDHNYCRNPSTNQPHAWCYNADGQSGAGGTDRWDFCTIPKCQPVKSCANDADDRDYRGTISVTQTGATCQKWTAQSPHSHGVTP